MTERRHNLISPSFVAVLRHIAGVRRVRDEDADIDTAASPTVAVGDGRVSDGLLLKAAHGRRVAPRPSPVTFLSADSGNSFLAGPVF